MKINKSYFFAAGAFLAIALWFWYNSGRKDNSPPPAKPAAEQSTAIPTVVVETREAEDHQNAFNLYGRTEANREVELKAKTAGLVISPPLLKAAASKRAPLFAAKMSMRVRPISTKPSLRSKRESSITNRPKPSSIRAIALPFSLNRSKLRLMGRRPL